ncbi:MAG TPA: guanylate kinase [Cryomorphaceae bacterium]|nr:guanylate kinase [Cryomorphaceae bacterium]|tara:strand:- start:6972 stop:7547 length:576 start_codon:yes stop_codon:yes gene_type:complete
MNKKNGKLVIFTAPSGAGKSTLVKYLLPQFPQLCFSISATSRAPRGQEEHGKDYYFLSSEEFQDRVAQNELLEWEEVYNGTYYGSLCSEVNRIWSKGKVVVFDIDVMGALNLKKQFGELALALFVQAPSIAVLEQRLRSRATDSEEKIQQRLAKVTIEMARAPEFDKVVVNDDLDTAKAEALAILKAFLAK